MNFQESMGVVQRDLPGLDQLCESIPTDEWTLYRKALKAFIPYVESLHEDQQTQLPSVETMTRELGFDDSMTTYVFRVLMYLAGYGVQMLEMRFSFIDGDSQYPVSYARAQAVLEGEAFHHPETGVLIENPDTKIHLIFSFKDQAAETQPN